MDVRIRIRYFDHRINYRNRKKNGLKILPSFNSNDIFILVIDLGNYEITL